MKGQFVCITQEQGNSILDILNDCVEDEECFKEEVGIENCRHCQIERAAGYLLDGGLILRAYSEDDGGT